MTSDHPTPPDAPDDGAPGAPQGRWIAVTILVIAAWTALMTGALVLVLE